MRRFLSIAGLCGVCLLLVVAPVYAVTAGGAPATPARAEAPPPSHAPAAVASQSTPPEALTADGTSGRSVAPTNNSTLKRDQYDGYGDDPAASSSQTIEIEKTVARTPDDIGRVTVDYTAQVPQDVARLRVYLNQSLDVPFTVTAASNMQYNASGNYWVVRSPAGQSSEASLSYTVATNVTVVNNQYEFVETGEFALVGSPQLSIRHQWFYYNRNPEFIQTNERTGPGLATESYVYLGELDRYTRTAHGQQFTVAIPPTAASSLSPQAYLDTLATASERLTVAGRDAQVTGFVVTDPLVRGGRAQGNTFFVHENAGRPLVLHEYVHTRQNWVESDAAPRGTASDAEWVTEAMADYYEGYLAWQAGYPGWDAPRFQRYLDEETSTYADRVLQDANDNSFERKNYEKGRRVLGALDIRIRQQTNGAATLADVFAILNRDTGGPLTYSAFRQAAITVTDDSTGPWVDEYVTTTAAPEIPADIETAYAGASSNTAPTADAGPAQTVTGGASVTLDASGSSDPDGEPLSYTWTQVDGPGVSVADATTATPSFAAPTVDQRTTLRFEVTVSDGSVSRTDTVTVTVTPATGALQVTAQTQTGTTVEGASVSITAANGTTVATATTASDGTVTTDLPTGTYTVAVDAASYLATTTQVTIEAGETTARTVTLAPATGALTGTVRTEAGDPLDNVTVDLQGASGATLRTTTTDATGHYTFSAVPVGDYRVTTTVDGTTGQAAVSVAANATTTADVIVALPAASGSPTFTVGGLTPADRTTTSAAVIDVSVTVRNTGDGAGTQSLTLTAGDTTLAEQSLQLQAGAETTITFADVPVSALTPGTYTLAVASANDTATGSLTIEAATPSPTPTPEPAPEPTPEPRAAVTVANQTTDGSTVTVARVNLSAGGFVTIHDDSLLDGATFDSVRGTSGYLPAGVHTDVRLSLDTPFTANATILAVPYRDTNGNQAYEYVASDGATDAPYLRDSGAIVTKTAALTVQAGPTITGPTTVGPVQAGELVELTYTVTNTQATAANAGRIEFALPPSLEAVGVAGDGTPGLGATPPSVLYGFTGPIAANQTLTTTVTVRVAADTPPGARTLTTTAFLDGSRSPAATTTTVTVAPDVVARFDTNGQQGIQPGEAQQAIVALNNGEISPNEAQEIIVALNDQ